MPNYVDEQLIQMQIDNRQFKKGATEALGILDKLKRALSFKDSNDGFDDLSRKIDRVDFSNLLYGVEAISDRFSTLGIVGKRVLENLTDSAYRFAESTVKSLSVDQISQGFEKYESMLTSTQTIMGATRNESDWESEREQLNYVNEELDKLRWYTDETSFNLTDMVNSVGKFTSAGVKLDDAVKDMQGITNWAASAGASYDEASRAMYNLSQAMATGSVKLMDWRSIENANMATVEFKNTVLATAESCGKLTKNADGTYKTLKGTVVTATNFAQTLSEGWFNTEVLERTLRKYGEFSDVLSQVSDDTGLTATDLLEAVDAYEDGTLDFKKWQNELFSTMDKEDVPSIEALQYAIETLSEDQFELGRRAFKSAQEYKTFGDVIKATQDAVSSGWMRTLQLIFGDYEESKKLWTAVGSEFYEIFAAGADRRNDIFEYWHDAENGGRQALLDGLRKVYEGVRSFIEPIQNAFSSVFSWGTVEEAGQKLVNISKKFSELADNFRLSGDAAIGLENLVKILLEKLQNGGHIIAKVLSPIKTLTSYLVTFGRVFLEAFSEGSFDKLRFFESLKSEFGSVGEIFNGLLASFGVVGAKIREVWTVVKNAASAIVSSIRNAFSSVSGAVSGARETLSGAFSDKSLGFKNVAKLSGLLFVLYKAFLKIRDTKWSIEQIVTPLKYLSDGISNASFAVERAFQRTGIVNTLLTFSIAIAILVAALVVLSSVDQKKLSTSLAIMAGAVAELVGSLELLRITAVKGGEKATKGLIALASSLLIMSVALKVLSSIDSKALTESLGYMFILLGEIFAFLGLITLFKIKRANFRGLTSLAVSVLILTGALFLLSKIPMDQLKAGMTALVGLLLTLSVSVIAMTKLGGGKIALIGVGLLFVAASVLVLVAALAALSFINPEKLVTSLIALGAAMLILAIAVNSMPAKLPLVGLGLIGVAAAILIIAVALAALALIDSEKLATSLLIVFGVLVMLIPVLGVMSLFLPGALALVLIGAAFALASVGLIALAFAMQLLANLPLTDIAVGLVAVGGALIVLAVGLLVMTVGIIGAVALLATAGALLALGAALNMMAGLPLAAIAGGLALLGLAFIPLGIGGLILLLGVPGLIAGAAAIALMGVALIPFAFGLKMLNDVSWETIVKYLLLLAGTAGALALLTPILTPLAIAVGVFGAACLAAGAGIKLVGDGMEKIANAVNVIPENAGTAFKSVGKAILQSVTDLAPDAEEFVNAITDVGERVILAIVDCGNTATQQLTDIFSNLLVIGDSYYDRFVDSGSRICSGIANGIADGSSIVVVAMHNLAVSMVEQFRAEWGIHSPSRVAEEMSANIVNGTVKGLSENSNSAVSAMTSLSTSLSDALIGALMNVQALIEEDPSFAPTITPVVDLSNIDSASERIRDVMPYLGNGYSSVSKAASSMRSYADSLAGDMQDLSDARASVSNDSYVINVYPTPGMDEGTVADMVIARIQNGMQRKGAAFG